MYFYIFFPNTKHIDKLISFIDSYYKKMQQTYIIYRFLLQKNANIYYLARVYLS